MKLDNTSMIGIAVTLILIAFVIYYYKNKEGYLVNSGLSWYNRDVHCDPPGGRDGTTPGYSGGCFTNSRVIF